MTVVNSVIDGAVVVDVVIAAVDGNSRKAERKLVIVVGLIVGVGVGVISRSGEGVEAVLVVGVGVEGAGVFVLAGRGELVVGCGG